MSLHKYLVYDLRVHAEIWCPELLPDPQMTRNPDVTIKLLPPIESVSESLENGYFETRPGIFRLSVQGVARYIVEDGLRISIEPQEGASEEEVRLYLLGSALGALLYQRGLFPLHGSAVETNWGAMIFVGEQGIGKSTLAAQFHQKGYRLLSDDVCAIATTSDRVFVLPALAQVRLCSDAYERFGSPQGARFHVDKFALPMGERYCSTALPLRAVHILVDGENENPKFEVLRGFDRIEKLLGNLYRPQYLKGQSTQSDLMRIACSIAKKATFAKVARRRDPGSIEELATFLESRWKEYFAEYPLEARE